MPIRTNLVSRELAQRFVDILNDALSQSPDAINELINNRVICDSEFAKSHPTIQCGKRGEESTVGMLGVINGLCGVDHRGYGPIVAVTEEGDIQKIIGFEVNKESYE